MRQIERALSDRLRRAALLFRALGKWLAVSAAVGLLCGLLGSVFHIGVESAAAFRLSHPWVLFTLPLAGVLAVAIYRVFRADGRGTNDILREVQTGEGLHWGLLPAIFFSTVLTHLAGGSAGREGAALQMGGTIGFGVGRFLRLDDRDLRTATMTGMAAFFSALFGTPLAASVFAMGVISVGLLYHAAFLPCLLASITAFGVSLLLGVAPTRFTVAAPPLSPLLLAKVVLLAALCGVLSTVFCTVIHKAEEQAKRRVKNPWLRAAAGGLVLLALTLLLRTGDYNGAGMSVIASAVEQGRALPAAFVCKTVFTAITLAVGFRGGEVVPSFFVGATFGCVVGPLLGIPAGFAAAAGLIAVFCGAVNCPIASILLAAELFDAQGLLPFALACGVSYVFSGYAGLYSDQRILYDKLKAQYIDVRANAHRQGDATETMKRFP